jgi:hypothetical protein
VDLNTFIVAVFCLIDDRIEDRALRARGPLPKLSDAEVLTIEVVGEFLGLTPTRGSFVTSGIITASGSPHCASSIAPPSLGRQPTSGRSRSASGKSS